MADDEDPAHRIRQLAAREAGLVEKTAFGGVAPLGGNLAVAASGHGGLLVRVDPERTDSIVAATPARPQIPAIAEPFVIGLGADIQMRPVMNLEDLQKGLAAVER